MPPRRSTAAKTPTKSASPAPAQKKSKAPMPSYFMEYVLDPFYCKIASLYPSWFSPNVITIFGIVCTITASMLFFTEAVFPVTNDATTSMPKSAAGFDFLWDVRPTSVEAWRASLSSSSSSSQKQNNNSLLLGNALCPLPSAKERAGMSISLPTWATASSASSSSSSSFQNSFVQVTDNNQWVFVLVGVLNWIYTIADNTDGKQARTYKLTSAIGEYLDHGLDMFSSLFSMFVIGATGGERIGIGYVITIGCGIFMILSHYHNYDTHEFIWGDRLFSVDEAMVLIATYPLLVGLFPSIQNVFVYGTNIRVIQLLVCVFALNMFPNIIKFIFRNKNVVNSLFFFMLFSIAAMTGWAVWHQGGMSAEVQQDFAGVFDFLSPYLAWRDDHHITCFAFPLKKELPALVRPLYQSIMLLCPPYALRVVGSRVLKLLMCYPACWTITMGCIASTITHIPIAAKCLKERRLQFVHLAGVLLMLIAFGNSPVAGMVVGLAWHLGQIGCNLARIQSKFGAGE